MKKFLSILLALLTLGFATAPVSAQSVWDGTADVTWYDASQTSFDLSTPEQLAGVAQLVNSGTATFSGMTLNLTADIWLNSDNDSTNNWVPIGGSATATGEDQSAGNAFQGVFNGHGHTIYNLYCEKQNYFHAGLFGCIKNPCTIDSLVMVNPVLKSKGMMGAIAGMSRSGGAIYIRYCLVINGRMQGTGGNNIGFMVGANYPNSSGTYIQNCGATGTISGNYPGGMGGNSQYETFTNCYFAGAINGSPSGGIAAYSGTLNNCYSYVSTSVSGGSNGTVTTQAEMQDPQMIVNLGDAFKLDNGVNNGYPVMSYMSGVDPIAASICQGESITITAFGFDTYAWNTGATTESITVSPTTTTTYTVTCTSNGVSTVLTSTVTVFPQAEITAVVVPGSDGQTHATLNQSTFTVGCGSSDNINLVVTPETNYRVCRVTLNGNEIYGDTFGEGPVTVTINPGGTLGEVKVFLSNEYTISITELLDTGDTLHVSSLVQPYGSNGVFTATAGNDQTFTFYNTARYALTDAEIDGVSQGVVSSYDFINIHEDHSIVVTYVDSCGISGLPFVEGFEGPTNIVPECYERITDNSYPYTYNYNAHSGSNSMYCYMYSTSTDYLLVFPKVLDTITYPMNELMVTFWARTSNTSNSYTVGVMSDPANASTFTAVQSFNPTSTNTYEFFTAYIGNAGQGKPYIAIKFDCGSTYTSTYIDDITVDFAPLCSPVTNLATTSVYGSNATLTWGPTTVGDVSEYNVVVMDLVNETEMVYTTTETTYLVTGLTELTSYQIGVFTTCTNGQSSDTAFVSFMTPCNNPVNYSVGNATTTNSYLPTNIWYGNSYTQQIVTADVFEGAVNDFASVSVKDNTTSSTSRACDIYLAHVPASMNLANGWILPSATNNITFTQVFSGNLNFGTGDWVKIDFDTVFPYNGTDNLLVVFSDHTNSYVSTHSYDVVGNSNTSSMARYAYRDGTPYNVLNPGVDGTLLSVVNTFRFSYCSASSCISPNTLSASNVTSNGADLEWVSAGSENTWEVEYKAEADTEWTSAGTVNSVTTSLFGLDQNTVYTVRVRALCSGSDMSPWSESITFRTQCDALTTLPYSTSFEDANGNYVFCWSRLASDASHMVYRYNDSPYAHTGSNSLDFAYTPNNWTIAIMPAFDASISVNNLMLDFWLDKTGNSGYFEVGVMTDPEDASTFEVVDTIVSTLIGNSADYFEHIMISLDTYTGNGQYVAFRASNAVQCTYRMDDLLVSEIPNCMYPNNFQALSSTNSSVTLAWTEMGDATSWNVLYDTAGFDPELGGTTVTSFADTFEVTGLDDVTTYDFYVQADCGSMQSQWVGPVTKTTGTYTFGITGNDTLTTCSVILYDDGGANDHYSASCDYTVVIYPETSGSGLSISGTVNTYNTTSTYYQGLLTIYEGVGTSGNVLGSYYGQHTVNLATSGPVTIKFVSGQYVTSSYYYYPGFELLVQCTDCYPPSNLAVSGQTLDGATVTWSGNASEYAVYLSGAQTGYYTTTDTSYTFTGLNSSSSYNVQVRALCGSDSSLLSSTAHFNTACGAITITNDNPWFEDFEGYSGGGAQAFVCWETPVTEVVDNGTSPFVYCGHTPSCHSGANSAELKGSNNMLALPEFSNPLQDLRLSFWATTTSTSNYGTVEVGYITDINDPTTFVSLGNAGTPGPRGSGSASGNGNFMGPFDFNGVTATSARMALKFTGYSGLSWNLDDFTVSLAPSCPSPVKTSVQATNVDGHNATITFTDNDPDHNSWTVYYKVHSDSVWSSVVTNTQSVDLNNLDPQTQYDVYVVTNCTTPDVTEDATLTIHFTTTVACPAPQNLTVSNIDMTSATVTWFSNADSFTIECGGTTATVTTNSYDLTGLTSGTAYTVNVTADCGVDGTSASASVNFNTTICAAADQCAYIFTLNDSWGDGWNGGTLAVKQNNITVATLGMTSGSTATETVNLCNGINTELVWAAGSYASEASFTVTGPDGAQLYASPTMDSYSTYSFQPNCSACGMPTALTVSNITTTSATVSWTGSADSYTVEYGVTGFTPGSGTTTTTTSTTIDLTGLTSATSYTVYITSTCGTEVSSTATADFATSVCDAANQCAYTFTLTDGFGDGWNGASLAVQQNGITMAVLEATNNNYTPSTETVTVSLCDNVSTSLVWTSGSYDEEAGFSIAGPDGTVLYTADSMNNYTTYTFTTDCGGSGPVITDPTVTTDPVTNVAQNAATLNGTITNPDNVTITAKGFEWKATAGGTYAPVTVTGNTLTYNLTGLTANTGYTYKAFITFNGQTVYGNEVTFTTLPDDTPEPCDVPTGLDTTNVANETIAIAWDANANVSSWNIQYRPQNGQWANGSSNTNSYTITGLTGNTTYEIQVQANCGNGNLSDWSASLLVTTKSVGIESWLDNSVTLYPNPAKEYVDIRVDGDLNVTMMEVYDVYGKLINTVNVIDNPTRVNVSGLADGMYFVRVTTEAGSVTKTFVKK